LHGARVIPVHFHRCARVEVPVVHGVLGYHWREHEELTRSRNCCYPNADGISATTL
jgi:hypothetical protein